MNQANIPEEAASFRSFVSGDALASACGHCFWRNACAFEDPGFSQGDLVFCKIDEVWRLFRALRRSRKRIVLVTGEGDKPVTPELHAEKPPHVFHWFGTNMLADAADTTPIPLGLGSETDKTTLNINEIGEASNLGIRRNNLLYANFGIASNPRVRQPLQEWLRRPEQGWITTNSHAGSAGKSGYLRAMFSHHFVLCPPGNGEDTHRMWEALYCGAIPIVRRSSAMRFFQDLPVLMVEDLRGVTEEMLHAALSVWRTRNRSLEKLDALFWRRRFKTQVEVAGRLGKLTLREWAAGWLKESKRITRAKLRVSGLAEPALLWS